MADAWDQFPDAPAPPAPPQPPAPPAPPAGAGSGDPWAAFPDAQDSAPAWTPPAAPPGEIIHAGGGRSYVSDRPEINVTVPPGADDRQQAVAMEALQRRGASDTPLTRAARPFLPMAQGATFNAGDDLTSLIFAGMQGVQGRSPRDAFDVAQEFQRQELAQQREGDPIKSAIVEMIGGGWTGGLAAKNGATIVGRMANNGLSNLLPRMAAGGLEGAGYAAMSGYAGAEGDIGDRAQAAVDNVPLGAAVGAGAVPLADLIGLIGSKYMDIQRGLRDPEAQADTLMVRNIARDETTPDALAQKVEAAAKAGQPEYRVADAGGKNLQRLGAMAAKTPSSFRNEVGNTLAARQGAQGDRISGFVNDMAGVKPSTAYATEEGLRTARSAAAQEAFGAADAAPTPTGEFYSDMLQRRSVQDALSTVKRIAQENQTPISDLFDEIPNPNPTIREVPSSMLGPDGRPIMRQEVVDPTITVPNARGWRLVKEALDTAVNTGFSSQDAATRAGAEAVKQTRNALRQQLSTDNPAYGQALRQFRDDSASIDAIQQGRDLIKARNPDEAAAVFGDIAPGDVKLGRLGAAREIGVSMDAMRGGQDKTLMFDTPSMKRKLDLIAEDPVARAIFADRLGREGDMVRAGRTLTAGSNTFENLADNADTSISSGGALASLFTGNVLNAAGKGLGYAAAGLARRAAGLSEPAANMIGDYLMSADPAKIRALSELFADYTAGQNAPTIAPAIAAAGVNAARDQSNRNGR